MMHQPTFLEHQIDFLMLYCNLLQQLQQRMVIATIKQREMRSWECLHGSHFLHLPKVLLLIGTTRQHATTVLNSPYLHS